MDLRGDDDDGLPAFSFASVVPLHTHQTALNFGVLPGQAAPGTGVADDDFLAELELLAEQDGGGQPASRTDLEALELYGSQSGVGVTGNDLLPEAAEAILQPGFDLCFDLLGDNGAFGGVGLLPLNPNMGSLGGDDAMRGGDDAMSGGDAGDAAPQPPPGFAPMSAVVALEQQQQQQQQGFAGAERPLVGSGGNRVVETSTGDLLERCDESRPLRITEMGLGDATKRTVSQLLKDEFDGLALMQPAPGMLGMISPQSGLTAVNFGEAGAPTRIMVRRGVGGVLASAEPGRPDQAAPDGTVLDANFVEGGYIASAAPRDSVTTAEFWAMVWQQRSGVVVSLCSLVENNVVTCVRYWPDEGQAHRYGDFVVFHKSTFNIGEITCRSLLVREFSSSTDEVREVVQLQCDNWPDAGIPRSTKPVEDLIVLAKRLRERSASEHSLTGPCVVHCSDGRGRTGSFIACDVCANDVLLQRLPRIPHTVHRLRQQRPGLVQTVQQHALIYAVIADVTRATGFDIQRRLDAAAADDAREGTDSGVQSENLLLSFLVMARELAASSEAPGVQHAPQSHDTTMMLPMPITDSGNPIQQPGTQQQEARQPAGRTPVESFSLSGSPVPDAPPAVVPADGPNGFSLNLRADSGGMAPEPESTAQSPGLFSLQLR
jgi:Protein-tyrosine phosphatase